MSYQVINRCVIFSLITGCHLLTPDITLAKNPTFPKLIVQSIKSLDENTIRQTMVAIEDAENKEDIDALLKFLVPFAISEITVKSQGTTLTTNVEGINAHRKLLKRSFDLVKERDTINDYITIRITPDGKIATVTRVVVETLTIEDGTRFLASGTDIFRFAIIDNQPKIISTKSQGWLEKRPNE